MFALRPRGMEAPRFTSASKGSSTAIFLNPTTPKEEGTRAYSVSEDSRQRVWGLEEKRATGGSFKGLGFRG